MTNSKRKYRLRKKWPVIVFIILSLCMLASGYLYASYLLSPIDPSLVDNSKSVNANDQAIKGRLNFLLLGIDARKGETVSRTDSIILASVDTQSKQAALLSIPRDTRVQIPGHGLDRINAAIAYGGPESTIKIVEKLLGVPVDYYVMTNFNGFKDIVNTLGGVTIDVEKNMYYYDPTDNFLINLKKGVQRMDGNKAIQYVRFRQDALGDISRTQRQQKFLEALAKEMLQPSTIVKLPKLLPQINKNVETNLGVMDMLSLARAGKDLDNMNIVTETLPGNFLDIDGVSYWGVDAQQAKLVVADLFKGEKAASVVQDSPPTAELASKSDISGKLRQVDEDNNKTSSVPVNQEQNAVEEVYKSNTIKPITTKQENLKSDTTEKNDTYPPAKKNEQKISPPLDIDVSITPNTVHAPDKIVDKSPSAVSPETTETPADIKELTNGNSNNTSGG